MKRDKRNVVRGFFTRRPSKVHRIVGSPVEMDLGDVLGIEMVSVTSECFVTTFDGYFRSEVHGSKFFFNSFMNITLRISSRLYRTRVKWLKT